MAIHDIIQAKHRSAFHAVGRNALHETSSSDVLREMMGDASSYKSSSDVLREMGATQFKDSSGGFMGLLSDYYQAGLSRSLSRASSGRVARNASDGEPCEMQRLIDASNAADNEIKKYAAAAGELIASSELQKMREREVRVLAAEELIASREFRKRQESEVRALAAALECQKRREAELRAQVVASWERQKRQEEMIVAAVAAVATAVIAAAIKDHNVAKSPTAVTCAEEPQAPLPREPELLAESEAEFRGTPAASVAVDDDSSSCESLLSNMELRLKDHLFLRVLNHAFENQLSVEQVLAQAVAKFFGVDVDPPRPPKPRHLTLVE